MSPTVSVIVNVFNGERYLSQCLNSVLNLSGNHHLEVIVADDCSQDRTADIIGSFSDSRIVHARLDRNLGAAAAVSYAFSLVRGEFVARIDYDDRYHADFLTASLTELRKHPEASFVCSNAIMIDADGASCGITGPFQYGEEPGCRDRFRSMLTRHFVTAPTILGRSSHWRRAMPIPAGMNFCDWYMNLVMAETAPVIVLDTVTADYRVHPLGMHVTKIYDGMGERVTFEVLERFIACSPRRGEIAPHERSIRALHYASWGDKYFGAGLNEHALRCYRAALSQDPSLAWRGHFLHRLAGLLVGRDTYEKAKLLAQRVVKPG